MKRLYLTCFTFFIFTSLLFSQYKKGYVITNANDTVYGYINDEGSIKNSEHCTFKLEIDSSSRIYKPGDIKAFRFINGKYFITSTIKVDSVPEKVFLQWLVKGRACLLSYYFRHGGVQYFIRLQNDSLYELKNSTRKVDKTSVSYTMQDNEYKGALTYYFRDCPSLFPYIQTLPYSRKSLINITKEYHEKMCGNDDCIVYEDKSKANFAIGASLSYLGSKLRLRNGIPEHVELSNTFGAGVVLVIKHLPIVSPKFSFQTAIMYFNSKYKYGDTTDLCSIKYFQLPFQLSYKFLHKKLSPFAFAGADVNIRFSFIYNNPGLLSYVTEMPAHYLDGIGFSHGIPPFQFGINGGFGLEYIVSKDLTTSLEFEYQSNWCFFGYLFPGENPMTDNVLVHFSVYHTIK